MSQLKNLYTYLIENRSAEVEGWLRDYIAISEDVKTVRNALISGKGIKDDATYAGTNFDSWHAFAERLLYTRYNGISSRGQSVLSRENFERFIQEQEFVDALANLIKQPTRENVTNYSKAWEATRQKYGANANPLLINRTLAACTTDVSTTVHGSDFDSVYGWLAEEGILQSSLGPEADWYDKNVELMMFLRQAFADELKEGETSEYLLSIFVWYLFKDISNPFTLKKQVVKYGAPGTGKTFSAKHSAELLFDIWAAKFDTFHPRPKREQCIEVVQFHPSYGYEDFIEGLRPVLDDNGQSQLKLQNGIFKNFCKQAGVWEVEVYNIPGKGRDLAVNWPHLTLGELKSHRAHLKDESWRGILQLDDAEKIADVVPPYFFIIDEINRAELSRVLGELMICIEYRGIGGVISTQYAALNRRDTAMLQTPAGYKFFIPHNVYIIGTMNTIDRSVESFDLALRRRFRWERINPDLEFLRYHLKQRDALRGKASPAWSGLTDDLARLNERIRQNDILGPDYEIGHAYLMNLGYPPALNLTEVRESVWEDSIRPLLEEYLRGSGRGEELIPEFQKAFGVS